MDLRWLAGLGVTVVVTCTLFSGYEVMMGAERYLSKQRAAGCLVGVAGHLPNNLAEECVVLFTAPGHVIRRGTGDDASMVGIPITRHNLRKIHGAVLVGAPDSMASAGKFDLWWSNLPMSSG